MACNPLWKSLGVIPLMAAALLGCAGGLQDIRQEINDDRRTARQTIAQREAFYEKHEYLGFSSDQSEQWNSTDWSLWMDTHGGGR